MSHVWSFVGDAPGEVGESVSLTHVILRGMITTVDAIYEDGELILQRPLPLPEHAHVRVTIDLDLRRAAWLQVSEESLKKVWDNDPDDIFNELLPK